MRIERRYTKDGQSPYADIAFRLTTSEIRNPDGSVVFKAENVEVPEFWSQVASDVLAQKYFRKAGVPAALKKVEEETVPSFLWRSVADTAALEALPAGSVDLPGELDPAALDRENVDAVLGRTVGTPEAIHEAGFFQLVLLAVLAGIASGLGLLAVFRHGASLGGIGVAQAARRLSSGRP